MFNTSIGTLKLHSNRQQYADWYTQHRWRVGCHIWYSEEGPGSAAAPPSPLLAVPNVPSVAGVPASYYSTWHYHYLCHLKSWGNFSEWYLCVYSGNYMTILPIFCPAAGEVAAAVWYEKSFTVDGTSPRSDIDCVHRCSAVVYSQPAHVYRMYHFLTILYHLGRRGLDLPRLALRPI